MKISGIKINDCVVAIKDIGNVQEKSVGMVRDISGEVITVFFVGSNTTIKTDSNYVTYLDVKKTGKPYDKKICNVCHLLKDMSEFDINQTDAKGRKTTRPSCKSCRIAIDGKHLETAEKKN